MLPPVHSPQPQPEPQPSSHSSSDLNLSFLGRGRLFPSLSTCAKVMVVEKTSVSDEEPGASAKTSTVYWTDDWPRLIGWMLKRRIEPLATGLRKLIWSMPTVTRGQPGKSREATSQAYSSTHCKSAPPKRNP